MSSPRGTVKPLLLAGALLWSVGCLGDEAGGGAAQDSKAVAAPAAADQQAAGAAPAAADKRASDVAPAAADKQASGVAPAAADQPASGVAPAAADKQASGVTPPPAPEGVALPALRYNSDVVTGDLFDPIQHAPQFEKLSREALGSPIELHVYHTYRIGRAAAEATGLLAAATLGLLPQVSSGSHSIVYEVMVNGVPVTSYKYSTTLTRVRNIWTQDKTHGLGEDGIKWARSTVDLFVKDAAADPKLMALRTEFNYYFGSAKP